MELPADVIDLMLTNADRTDSSGAEVPIIVAACLRRISSDVAVFICFLATVAAAS